MMMMTEGRELSPAAGGSWQPSWQLGQQVLLWNSCLTGCLVYFVGGDVWYSVVWPCARSCLERLGAA